MKNSKIKIRPFWITIISIVTILFGMMTIKEGGSVLFTDEGKLSAGNYVPFVLWFNFLAGFAYIAAGFLLFKLNSCARHLALAIALSTSLVFIFFYLHILNGGAYEMRTIFAMTLRSSIWISIAVLTLRWKALKPKASKCK